MAVIKAANSNAFLKDAIVLDLGDIGRQGERLKTVAQIQARKILDDAQKEAARLTGGAHQIGLEQGRTEGLAQGLEQGRKEGRAQALTQAAEELQRLQAAWTQLAGQLEEQRQDIERNARMAVLELAVKLGQKVTHRLVKTDPALVVDQAAAALAHVLRPVDVTVRVHPDDRPLLQEALPKLLAHLPHLQHVHLADDPTAARGGCVLTYGQGRIDATVETQLERIAEVLVPNAEVQTKDPSPAP